MPRVSKEVKAITTQISKARLERLQNQNKKLKLELAEKAKALVSFDHHKREVLAANSTVKQQVLSVPVREGPKLGLTREQIEGLNLALIECLNDLAYSREEIKSAS